MLPNGTGKFIGYPFWEEEEEWKIRSFDFFSLLLDSWYPIFLFLFESYNILDEEDRMCLCSFWVSNDNGDFVLLDLLSCRGVIWWSHWNMRMESRAFRSLIVSCQCPVSWLRPIYKVLLTSTIPGCGYFPAQQTLHFLRLPAQTSDMNPKYVLFEGIAMSVFFIQFEEIISYFNYFWGLIAALATHDVLLFSIIIFPLLSLSNSKNIGRN